MCDRQCLKADFSLRRPALRQLLPDDFAFKAGWGCAQCEDIFMSITIIGFGYFFIRIGNHTM